MINYPTHIFHPNTWIDNDLHKKSNGIANVRCQSKKPTISTGIGIIFIAFIINFQTIYATTQPQLKSEQTKIKQPNQANKNQEVDLLSLNSKNEVKLLQELSVRRKELETKEQAVQQQSILLKIAQKKVDEDLKSLNTIKDQVQAMLDKIESNEKQHISNMDKIFENMPPKKAAQILDHWEPKLTQELIKQMNKRKAAAILAAMNVQKAKEITSHLTEESKEK